MQLSDWMSGVVMPLQTQTHFLTQWLYSTFTYWTHILTRLYLWGLTYIMEWYSHFPDTPPPRCLRHSQTNIHHSHTHSHRPSLARGSFLFCWANRQVLQDWIVMSSGGEAKTVCTNMNRHEKCNVLWYRLHLLSDASSCTQQHCGMLR